MHKVFPSQHKMVKMALLALAIALVLTPAIMAQTVSGSISGTVVDAQRAGVPSATVTVTDEEKKFKQTAKADAAGRFVFAQVSPGTVRLTVQAPGFKEFIQDAITVNANDRIALGEVIMQVGAVTEHVEVSGAVVLMQTESAERSDTLASKQILNIAVNSRSPLDLVKVVPGVVSTVNLQTAGPGGLANISANGGRVNSNQLNINGIGNTDTGSNGSVNVTLSLDSIEEFKILTGVYQAEYGRAMGAQINVVTKSGSNALHGSGYFQHRNDSLNANNWKNNRDGLPRNIFRLNDTGYTIGGPVVIPKVFNGREKLFFFVSEEFQRQLRPQGVRQITVPTALERTGDFSNSVDNNGAKINIFDPTTSGCVSSSTVNCYNGHSQFPNNVIPTARLNFAPGTALLKLFPLPNVGNSCAATGVKTTANPCINGYDYQSQISDQYPRREDLIRIDYNMTSKQRLFGHWIYNNNTYTGFTTGSFVLNTNTPLGPYSYANPGHSWAVGHTYIINSTTTNELNIGSTFNSILIDEGSSTAYTRGTTGVALPLLYPSALQRDYIPQITFGGKNGNSPSFNTNDAPFINHNTTFDITDGLSKVWGKHAMKVGAYINRSWKDQTSFGAFNGNYIFTDTTQNPLDTNYALSNVLLGVYNQFNQAANMINGLYRYWNLEFYAQDTWKITPRLTLDYGIRAAWIQPQYDASLQASTFIADKWDPSKAPRLYQPVISPNCPLGSTNGSQNGVSGPRCAYDQSTNTYQATALIGFLVPSTGSVTNGIYQSGQGGVNNYLSSAPPLQWGPRVGAAWDITGEQKFVVRAGAGIYYDRYQGNRVFDFVRNPPLGIEPVLRFGQAQDIKPGAGLLSPPTLYAADQPGKIPMSMNFQLAIQTRLPHGFVLDTAYVGNLSRHLEDNRNLNYTPYGAYFLPQNQDVLASSLPGGAAKPSQFMKPFLGDSSINLYEAATTANYHSMQITLQKRAGRFFLGTAYTWSKYLTTSSGDTNFVRVDQYTHSAYYGPSSNDRRHSLAINYVYDIPTPFKGNLASRAIFGGWQVSGVTRLQSGAPFTPGFSINGIGNQNITGSDTEGARVAIVSGQNAYVQGDAYHRLNAAAFAPPLAPSCSTPTITPTTVCTARSIGLESGNNFLSGPGINNFDLSLQKSFKLGKERPVEIQLRADAFNVFNHTQFSGYNTSITFSVLSPTAANPFNAIAANTYQNGQFGAIVNGAFSPATYASNLVYNPDGSLNNKNGFGSVSGARDPRILQLFVRVRF